MDPRRRAERALVQVVAECYVKGVSTRRVDGLVRTLGIDGISKSQVSELAKSLDEAVEAFRSRPLDTGPYTYLWLDALQIRCREAGRIVSVILGTDIFTTEDGAGWTQFTPCARRGSPPSRTAWPRLRQGRPGSGCGHCATLAQSHPGLLGI